MASVLAETTAPSRPEPTAARPRGALVLGGEYRALGVVRSLGRRGVPVHVVLEGDDRLAGLSRFCRRRFPWPEEGEREQVEHLLALAESEGLVGWALIPSGDETAALISRNHDELGRSFTLTTPPWADLVDAYDKRRTYDLADRLGLDQPRTLIPANRGDLERAELDFPVVLKPAVKESFNRLTAAKAWRVDSHAELLERYDEACELVAPDVLMVQELIPGGGDAQFSYAALCRDGHSLAGIVARRTRQYPSDFGRASTFVESIDLPEVRDLGVTLFEAMGFTGLIEAEFKRDPRDGRYKLLDMNPRVWGWHTLGAAAGVDFSHLLWLMVSGHDVPRVTPQPGVRWVRTSTDLPNAVRDILGRRLSPRDYFRSLRRPRETAIFALDDPLPGLYEYPMLLRTIARRLAHGRDV